VTDIERVTSGKFANVLWCLGLAIVTMAIVEIPQGASHSPIDTT
jgi:hypothetical protein